MKSNKPILLLILILGFLTLQTAQAHHAKEYIEMDSYSTAKMGEFVFHLHYDYMVENKNIPFSDHWEFTPGLSYGITSRLMMDVHTHFAKFGNSLVLPAKQAAFDPVGPSPFMEAIALSAQYRITKNFPVQIALAAVFEAPFKRSKELLDGQQVIEGIFIASHSFGEHSNLCLNLTWGKDGDATVQNWALGFKTPLTVDPHGIAAGVEFLGSFDDFENWSVLPGIYMPLGSDNLTLKTGLEFSGNGERIRANMTLMALF